MENPLTGEFTAVLQISAATINRLLASMHQNTASSSLPKMPHDSFIRVGDDTPVDGIRGTVRAQVSVPSIELIHGSQDHTAFRIWLRIWYTADSGTPLLREFSYGQMRAEYGLQIRNLPQTHETPKGGAYGFFGFIPGSVSFTSYGPDHSSDAAIAKQLEAILIKRYIPKPHPMLNEFTERRFLSLIAGSEQAVAHSLDLDGSGSAANIATVKQIFLGGKDFAVAISREYIMSLFNSSLESLRSLNFGFWVKVSFIKIKFLVSVDLSSTATYAITITDATAEWAAGTINLHVAGNAKSDKFWAPDADFSIDQALVLSFDPVTETLSLTPSGSPSVSVNVGGPYGSLVESNAKAKVTSVFNSQLSAALAAVKPQLQKATAQKLKLITQLQTVDPIANAVLESAVFTADGMILKGSVSLAPRALVQLAFQKLDNERGYTAFATWAPGGRVIEYRWRWEFDHEPAPPPGSENQTETFLLYGRTGLPALPPPVSSKLPTISGTLCLAITAAQVNAVTGTEDLVDSVIVLNKLWCLHLFP